MVLPAATSQMLVQQTEVARSQAAPAATQAGGAWQLPATQARPAQQSAVAPQACVEVLHAVGAWQLPERQERPVQQSEVAAQAWEAVLQAGGVWQVLPEAPATQERPVQHSPLEAQAPPEAVQVTGGRQAPAVQERPAQHSAEAVQEPPETLQVGAAWQLPVFNPGVRAQPFPLQQSASEEQLLPTTPQVAGGGPHFPATQASPVQQSELVVQLPADAAQPVCVWQVPAPAAGATGHCRP